MTVKKIRDFAQREITLWVNNVPNIDGEVTSTGKGVYVQKVTIEYISEDRAPWEPEYVLVHGIAVNKNGRLSMASNAEVSERFMMRSEHMPAWLKGMAHDWNPSDGGH